MAIFQGGCFMLTLSKRSWWRSTAPRSLIRLPKRPSAWPPSQDSKLRKLCLCRAGSCRASSRPHLPISPPASPPPGARLQEKRDRLFYVVEKSANDGRRLIESLVAYGDPAEELIHFCRRRGAMYRHRLLGKGMVSGHCLQRSTKVALHANVPCKHRPLTFLLLSPAGLA